jgi:acetyl-CoA C-acetyltransferase
MANSENSVVIVSAARTPVGSFNGALASVTAHALGAIALKAAMARAKVEAKEVDEVIMGQILTAGQGQNPARQASIAAGIPVESPACSRSPMAMPISLRRAVRNPCRWRPIVSTCAMA